MDLETEKEVAKELHTSRDEPACGPPESSSSSGMVASFQRTFLFCFFVGIVDNIPFSACLIAE